MVSPAMRRAPCLACRTSRFARLAARARVASLVAAVLLTAAGVAPAAAAAGGYEVELGHECYDFVVSADEKYFAATDYSRISVYEIGGRKIASVQVSPTQRFVDLLEITSDGDVAYFSDAQAPGAPLHLLRSPGYRVAGAVSQSCVGVSLENQLFARWSKGEIVVERGLGPLREETARFDVRRDGIHSLRFLPKADRAVGLAGYEPESDLRVRLPETSSLWLFDLAGGRGRRIVDAESEARRRENDFFVWNHFAIAGGANCAVVAGYGRSPTGYGALVRVINLLNPTSDWRELFVKNESVRAIDLCASGSHFVIVTRDTSVADTGPLRGIKQHDYAAAVYEVAGGRQERLVGETPDAIVGVAFGRDERSVYVGYEKGLIKLISRGK